MSRKCSLSFLINSFVSTAGLGILIPATIDEQDCANCACDGFGVSLATISCIQEVGTSADIGLRLYGPELNPNIFQF